MTRTRVKICGVCRAEDAQLAARLGADAIGVVRAETAGRYVAMAEAARIVAALPAFVTPVLLYVDAPFQQILADLSQLSRSAVVQLHGHEPIEFIRQLAHVTVIKAVRVDDTIEHTLDQLRSAKLTNLAGVVLESPGQVGGSGVGNDWTRVAQLRSAGAFEDLPAIIASGGLTPANVAAVARSIRPDAMDVSSGVEVVKRRKSAEKIEQFIAAVRSADEERE